ncbi:MAG: acyloxyacyl hydrolase [Salinivirgaceae bacterium]
MLYRKVYLAFIFVVLYTVALAQDKYPVFGASYSYGGILRHSNELPEIRENRVRGFTVTAARFHTSKQKWEQCYCYPLIGAGVAAYDFGDPQVLGNSINPFLFVAPKIFPNGRLYFVPRGGAGMSYVSKVYDANSNPENTFFSSHLSFFLQMDISVRYQITKQLSGEGSVSYNHISNGGIKQPNKGMNFITANVGLNYYLTAPQIPRYTVDRTSEKNEKWRGLATSFFSLKVAKPEEGYNRKNGAIFGANIKLGYSVPRFSLFTAGVEYVADMYLQEQLMRAGEDVDFQRIALLLGHAATFGRLSFITDLGIYVYSPAKAPDPVYQHYALTYRFGRYLFAGVGLKAHRHVAELMLINSGVYF